jgi:hypothetical protein
MRFPPLKRSEDQEVQKRIDPGAGYVGIGCPVVFGVEQVAAQEAQDANIWNNPENSPQRFPNVTRARIIHSPLVRH